MRNIKILNILSFLFFLIFVFLSTFYQDTNTVYIRYATGISALLSISLFLIYTIIKKRQKP